MPAILRIEDLSVEYRTKEGTVPAARAVHLEMERGRVTALVGESGAERALRRPVEVTPARLSASD